ncbi:para-nitrobenzyl esterase [Butyrivibrio sp. ob235]|uniref:carboxylesterase/lipase family protein n=1 Tax=Butyrivibrio sp. ob235 TaxID=1761780 RepID=UPI0008B052A2|nr:carboxylesterase family protein [Butyrivibrio sp. ob235]SEL53813.1 para-nitrobenzyl esterase [Butyrivibrio sp. ob235]
MAYSILIVIITILYILLLELSKNTLLGWAVGIILAAALFCIRMFMKKSGKWDVRTAIGAVVILLMLFAVNYKLTSPPVKRISAVTYKNPEQTAVIHVAQGDISGVYNEDHSAEIFAGVPYAKPPVGDLRWKEPQDPDSWAGVRICDTYGPMAMQPRSSELYSSLSQILGTNDYRFSLTDQYRDAMSEDCLYLNVFRPADYSGEPLPVVFFIHGGSLTTGQSYYTEYRGESFAKKDVILVNFAYRLGILGYMANDELAAESVNHTTGDYGLLDQIKALEWVHENIGAFGGDPDNITIAGESAGSSSVQALCVSPLTKGLFVRAIAESSGIAAKKPYHTFRDMSEALVTGDEILKEFGAKNVAELRKIDAEKLITTKTQNSDMCVDGYAIAEQPYLTYEKGENHEQALLNGSNLKEADAFLLSTKATSENYEEILMDILGDYAGEAAELIPPGAVERDKYFIIDPKGDAKGSLNFIYSDAWFSYSHNVWSRYMEAQGRDVYQYFFTKTNPYLSNNHAGEMPYAYGNLFYHPGMYNDSDYELSEIMQTYWTNFAKTGDPNKGSDSSETINIPEWPKWNSEEDKLLEFNDEIKLIDNPYHELNKIIDKYQNE